MGRKAPGYAGDLTGDEGYRGVRRGPVCMDMRGPPPPRHLGKPEAFAEDGEVLQENHGIPAMALIFGHNFFQT